MKFLSFPSVAAALWASGVYAASLTQVTNFGTNPTNVQMWVYKPDKLQSTTPPLLVAMHYCTGTAQAYYSGTDYHTLADKYGFIVIYPNAPDSGGCWDVHTTATLTHNSGGDSLGIASMVRYAISTWSVDATRVFATGTSSGAMMTSVLMGAYPDLFAGGSAFAGVPYGCFAGPDLWNSACANGQLTKTAQQWGDSVRSGYPGYTGTRPKVQIWHGTADTTLYPQNFDEEIKQWTNVFGVSSTPSTTTQNSPLSGWTRMQYGPSFQAIKAQGVPHNIPVQAADALAWFGLDKVPTTTPTPTTATSTKPTTSTIPTSTMPTSTTPTSITPTSTKPTSTTPTPTQTGTVAHWGQCGGMTWTGGTVCLSPWVCTYANPYYSQCL